MKYSKTGLLIVSFVIQIAFAQDFANDLLNLEQVRSGMVSRRASSSDTTGGNSDFFRGIMDGETRTIFDVPGAGIMTPSCGEMKNNFYRQRRKF